MIMFHLSRFFYIELSAASFFFFYMLASGSYIDQQFLVENWLKVFKYAIVRLLYFVT